MRRTTQHTVVTDGRDKGKTFFITEMPASKAEKWATRALLLAAAGGAEVENVDAGFAGIAIMGVQSVLGGLKWGDVEPLLDEIFECVTIQPDPLHNPTFTRKLREEDIEEVATRIELRGEVFSLHLGFSFADALSKLKELRKTSAGSENTETSPAQ